jgi:organic radical activating enzyme
MLTPDEVLALAGDDDHVCITGGEPLDRDLRPLLTALILDGRKRVHVETSGTKWPAWLDRAPGPKRIRTELRRHNHAIGHDPDGGPMGWYDYESLWVTISPKPGYSEEMVLGVADEVKVILGGLGDGPGWPTVEDAVRWADLGKLVYVQPRNGLHDVDRARLDDALTVVARHPQVRISPQVHKFLMVR